jgi:putative addiction module CopG family antidote
MNVELPSDVTDFVRELIVAGRFASEREAIAEALRLLQSREQLRGGLRTDSGNWTTASGWTGRRCSKNFTAKSTRSKKSLVAERHVIFYRQAGGIVEISRVMPGERDVRSI